MLHCQQPGHMTSVKNSSKGSSVRVLAGISHQGGQRLVSYANTSIAFAIQGYTVLLAYRVEFSGLALSQTIEGPVD